MKPTDNVFVAHRIGLERYSSHTVKEILTLLRKVQKELQLQIIDGYTGTNLVRHKRLLKVLKEIQHEGHLEIRKNLGNDLKAVAKYESEWAHKFYSEGVGVGAQLEKPSAAILRSIVKTNPFRGEVLSGWAKKMERNQLERITRELRMSMVRGDGVVEIIQRLKGTSALKFKNGQFFKDQRNAEALVRTATTHVTNQAHKEFGLVNGKALGKIQHVSVLDNRTTPICQSRAGVIYKAEDFEWPPLHWRCRSTGVWVSEYDDEAKSELQYDDWLRQQPKKVVQEILGKSKSKLFLDGKLKINKFVNRKGNELTLDQLKVKENEAWERAFK